MTAPSGTVFPSNESVGELFFRTDQNVYYINIDGTGGGWTDISTGDIGVDLGEFTVAGLPTASSNANAWALATDASGGRTVVRSDGTNWKVIAVEGATVTT